MRETTCVYVMRDRPTGIYKIGKSIHPARRLTEICYQPTLLPVAPDIELVCYWTECWSEIEASAHHNFRDYHVRGEWFNLPAEVLGRFIATMEVLGFARIDIGKLGDVVQQAADKHWNCLQVETATYYSDLAHHSLQQMERVYAITKKYRKANGINIVKSQHIKSGKVIEISRASFE